jgi:epoxyqueuosine reductase
MPVNQGAKMAHVTAQEDPARWVTTVIRDILCDPTVNTLCDPANERAWDDPLVGFSRGDDPLFQQYKEYVGPFHWTPIEIFDKTFPAEQATPGELTVISWVLPQTEATKADNRKEMVYPAERWARARIYGEQVNNQVRQRLVDALLAAGYTAMAPMSSPYWHGERSERFGRASTWSERHAAYAAGLGTFGLCDGLITPKGKAMRVGSAIARMEIPATPRPYADHHAYCLFFSQGICGECIDRCPVGAISEAGHDKGACSRHLRPSTAEYVKSQYGFDGYGCGLCQTGVPCESKIPTAEDVSPS